MAINHFRQTTARAMNPTIKYVLSILMIIVIGVCGIWMAGGKKLKYSTSLTINAPADVVFSFVKDTKVSSQWISGLVDVEPMPNFDVDENDGVGKRFKFGIESDGSRVDFVNEILRYEENQKYSSRATSRLFTQLSVIDLNDKEDGTTYVTYRIKQTNRQLGRLLKAFSSPPLKEKIQNDVRRLKELSEQAYQDSQKGSASHVAEQE